MLIMRYCGGLGNQMFQHAMHLALQKKYPNQKIKADLHHYNLENEHNGFELENYFGIKLVRASRAEIKRLFNGYVPGRITASLPTGVKKKIVARYQYYYWALKNKLFPWKKKNVIQDADTNGYNSRVDCLDDKDYYIRGLWQNVQYFDLYRNELLDAFPLRCEVSEKDRGIIAALQNGEGIAVHIRGGDFLNPKFNLCGQDYYKKAIGQLRADLPLYVFTDDAKYAKKILDGFEVKDIISHPIDCSKVDMYMLSQAKFTIISNSTFSFWGAYLNQYSDQVVVCPKYATQENSIYRPFPSRKNWIQI